MKEEVKYVFQDEPLLANKLKNQIYQETTTTCNDVDAPGRKSAILGGINISRLRLVLSILAIVACLAVITVIFFNESILSVKQCINYMDSRGGQVEIPFHVESVRPQFILNPLEGQIPGCYDLLVSPSDIQSSHECVSFAIVSNQRHKQIWLKLQFMTKVNSFALIDVVSNRERVDFQLWPELVVVFHFSGSADERNSRVKQPRVGPGGGDSCSERSHGNAAEPTPSNAEGAPVSGYSPQGLTGPTNNPVKLSYRSPFNTHVRYPIPDRYTTNAVLELEFQFQKAIGCGCSNANISYYIDYICTTYIQ